MFIIVTEHASKIHDTLPPSIIEKNNLPAVVREHTAASFS